MAWSTPKTDFSVGDLVTAAQLNSVGNNLVYLHDNRMILYTVWVDTFEYEAQTGSTYVARGAHIRYHGSLIDESDATGVFFGGGLRVDTGGSNIAYAKLYDLSGPSNIDASEISVTGTTLTWAESGDISGDANFPAGDATLVLYLKANTGGVEARYYYGSLWVAF